MHGAKQTRAINFNELGHLKIHSNGVIISKELNKLNVTFDDVLFIGEFKGVIIGIIVESEPDINVQSLALGPRVYTSITNNKKTGLIAICRGVYYSRFYSFEDDVDIVDITKSLEEIFSIQSNDKSVQGSLWPKPTNCYSVLFRFNRQYC